MSPPARSRHIRPTSDKCREALFNILGDRVTGAIVLDLFAGTGALGLEALSRGAEHAVFIDNNPAALSIISKNCTICLGNHPSSVTVLKRDLKKPLKLEQYCFDLIFMDPPYSKGLALHCLKRLSSDIQITPEATLVVEERGNVDIPETAHNFVLVDRRNYGDTSFWFYCKK